MYLFEKNRHTIFGKKVEIMEKAKKRVRICLICVVIVAVVMGILYYYHGLEEGQAHMEGTLVSADIEGWKITCR